MYAVEMAGDCREIREIHPDNLEQNGSTNMLLVFIRCYTIQGEMGDDGRQGPKGFNGVLENMVSCDALIYPQLKYLPIGFSPQEYCRATM